MSIQDYSTETLVETRDRYRDRLATLPRWRWLARYIIGLALEGIGWELMDRRGRREWS